MGRGRPPKPESLRLLHGDTRKTPGNPSIPRPDGQPVAPDWLDEIALEHWNRVVPELVRLGVAKSIDADTLAGMCDWWSKFRQAESINHRNMAFAQWFRIAGRFGLNPSDRVAIVADEPDSIAHLIKPA